MTGGRAGRFEDSRAAPGPSARAHLHRPSKRFSDLDGRARIYLLSVGTIGLAAAGAAGFLAPPTLGTRCLLFIAMTVAAGLIKVPMPVVGTFSLGYAFVLATLVGYGLGASTIASVLSAVASGLLPVGGVARRAHRTFLNVGIVGLASSVSGVTYLVLGGHVGSVAPLDDLLPIAGHTLAFSILNLGLISIAIALSGDARASSSLRANFAWTVPGYVAGSSLAVLLILLQSGDDLALLLLAAPFVYLVRLAYRARVEQVEQATSHSRQSAELYRSVTEALALAIEAKDEGTEEHLHRVQQFCLGIGRRLGLPDHEMEALRAAALLHDIGKIAVPEYILTKPGRLTPEEADKMMIHPRVGADILSAVPFPYPLAPTVRHHHERWDGNGYPDRLARTAIPLGARILAVVDCYDALTSDRPYRKAISRDEALAYIREQAGKMFDPAVVDILLHHHEELERRVRDLSPPRLAPSAGPAVSPSGRTVPEASGGHRRARVYDEISASHRELEALYDIARTVGHHLELHESLTVLSAKIASLVPYRALVVYLFDDSRHRLVARYATGSGADRLRGLTIPVGERLSGWAALHQRTYAGHAHLNPLERDGSRSDLEEIEDDPEIAELRSAIVAPLSTAGSQLGVLALYHDAAFTYTGEHHRLLSTIAGHVAQAVRNTFLFGMARGFSLTDHLTGIPNSRFFFLEAGHRVDAAEGDEAGFGILALRLLDQRDVRGEFGARAQERLVSQFARRLAAACQQGETLVRFGWNLFLILSPEARRSTLVARGRELADAIEQTPIELRLGVSIRPRVIAVQASYPEDGRTPETLLDALETRLCALPDPGGCVVPFPARSPSVST